MTDADRAALHHYIQSTQGGALASLTAATEAELRRLWEREDRTQEECDAIMLDFEERFDAIIQAAIDRLIAGALGPWRDAGRSTQ
jgi:hypothetical protein